MKVMTDPGNSALHRKTDMSNFEMHTYKSKFSCDNRTGRDFIYSFIHLFIQHVYWETLVMWVGQ